MLFKVDGNYKIIENEEDFGLKIGGSTPIGFPAFTQKFTEYVHRTITPEPEYPPVILIPQFWPMLLPTILQPTQNINFNINYYPNNNFQYPPVIIAAAPPYNPCVIRQVPIPIQYVDYQKNYPQVISVHNYHPVNYFGGINQVNQYT